MGRSTTGDALLPVQFGRVPGAGYAAREGGLHHYSLVGAGDGSRTRDPFGCAPSCGGQAGQASAWYADALLLSTAFDAPPRYLLESPLSSVRDTSRIERHTTSFSSYGLSSSRACERVRGAPHSFSV